MGNSNSVLSSGSAILLSNDAVNTLAVTNGTQNIPLVLSGNVKLGVGPNTTVILEGSTETQEITNAESKSTIVVPNIRNLRRITAKPLKKEGFEVNLNSSNIFYFLLIVIIIILIFNSEFIIKSN